MADIKDNGSDIEAPDTDFDFSGSDWEDVPTEPKVATAAAGDPFGADSFSDDDVFGGAAKESEAEDPFATAATADPFGLDDEDPFSFQDMPTPGARAEKAAAPGNPDDEFGDIAEDGFGGNAFAQADGFDAGDGLFEDDDKDTPEQPDEDDDPFADDAGDAAREAKDPFADDDAETAADGQEPHAGSAPPRRGNRLVVPLALAASVAFAGYVGYSVLLPMFASSPPVPVETAVVIPADPAFPAALPGQPGGLGLPEAPAAPAPSAPVLPSVPAVTPPQLTDPDLSMGTTGAEQPSLPAPDAPVVVDAAAPPAKAEPVLKAPDGAAVPSLDDIVGGEGRGGIVSMRGPDTAEAPLPQVDLSAIEARIAAIEKKVDDLAAKIAGQPSPPVSSVDGTKQMSAAPAAADLSASIPPLKPEILESATLKGVSRDLAWVSTGSGVVEVREGDTIPGAGRVLKIREYEGRWIVVTSDGIVVQ